MPSRRGDRLVKRIAAVDGAEDRAAEPEDAGDVARRQQPRLFRIDQAVEAVLEADDLDAGVVGRLDDGADDGVEAGGVAAAGEHADFFDSGHSKTRAECADGDAAVEYSNRVHGCTRCRGNRVLH